MIDQRQLIGQVAAKNGIRLEPDDPAFALVTLNEAVLQDASAALTQEIRQVSQQLYGITGEDGAQGRQSTRSGCEDRCSRVAARTELRHRKSQPESE